MTSEYLILFLVVFPMVGILTGFLSGMLGIGGSVIVIPALYLILEKVGIPHNQLMHFAIGTAFSIMVFTSMSNAVSHLKLKNVIFAIVRKMIAPLILGIIIGSWIIGHIDSEVLSKIFAVFLTLIAIDIFLKFSHLIRKTEKEGTAIFIVMGLIIGIVSGMLGIGGGSITIPFLLYMGFNPKNVIGSSAVLTLPIALCGTATSVLHTTHIHSTVPMSVGFIYLPALICISVFCVICVPFGAKFLGKIPQDRARQIFAAVLLLTSIKMLLL